MNKPKIEKWVLNLKKIKQADIPEGEPFIDNEYTLSFMLDTSFEKPPREELEQYLQELLDTMYFSITNEHTEFFEE